MLRMIASFWTVVTATLLAVSPLSAADGTQPDEAASDQVLTVPFNPPLGTPLIYSFVEVTEKTDKEPRRKEVEQELVFEKIENGFLLRITTLAMVANGERVDLTDEKLAEEIPPEFWAVAQIVLKPVEAELDEVGEMVRLRNWPALRDNIIARKDFWLSKMDVENQGLAKGLADAIFGPMVQASAEEAPYFYVKGWPHVLGYGGLELEDGATYEAEHQMEVGLSPALIDAVSELSLETTQDGHLAYWSRAEADKEQFLQAVTGSLEDVGDIVETTQDDEAKAKWDAAELNFKGAELVDEIEIEFDRITGLPRSASSTKRVSIEEAVETESFTIKLISGL